MAEEAAITAQEADGLRAAVAKVLAESDEDRAVQLLGGLLVVCSFALLAAEKDGGGLIKSFGDALWNALTTVAGVGESGCPPVTPAGRLVGAILTIVGNPLYDKTKGRVGGLLEVVVGGKKTEQRSSFETELMGKLDQVLERV